MRYKTLLRCFVASGITFLIFGNGWAQTAFRLGTWCLQEGPPAPQAIYTPSPDVWRIYTNERDKLLNLGLNYFIACTGLNAEDALVFMGDSLDSAPTPKSFKSTLEWVPITLPLFPQTYQLWKMSQANLKKA